jgi:hypothetical protein
MSINSTQEKLIADLGVTLEHFSLHSGISMTALMTYEDEFSQSRCDDISAILNKIRPWFDSYYQCWSWYIGQPIMGLGNITAAEIIKQNNELGVKAINDYIASKKLAGYE